MIDVHVHLRDWEQSNKETLAHGMGVALSCGVDEVFDMPNTNPPLTGRTAILKRFEDAQACNLAVCYHLWAGVTSDRTQLSEMVALHRELFPRVIGLKMFAGHSTGNMGLTEEETQKQVYHTLAHADYQGVLALHCEKESLLRPNLERNEDFSSHSLARPVEAEVASVRDQLRFALEAGFKGHLHICHLSSIETLSVIEDARAAGVRVSCGVTPHHALLSQDDAKDRSLYAKMNPPLRSETERSALFAVLLAGRIDWIETDHAPHTLADKEGGASGIPGFSGMLLLLKALIEAGAQEDLLLDLVGKRALRVFGLSDRVITMPLYDELASRSLEAAKAYPFDSFANFRLRW